MTKGELKDIIRECYEELVEEDALGRYIDRKADTANKDRFKADTLRDLGTSNSYEKANKYYNKSEKEAKVDPRIARAFVNKGDDARDLQNLHKDAEYNARYRHDYSDARDALRTSPLIKSPEEKYKANRYLDAQKKLDEYNGKKR